MSKDINLTEGTVTEVLNDKVDIDFNNVPSNSVGFARCSTEVTNCITSVPNRIKYTLVDGVLTILKGSVAVVPYGTEDLTSQFPVGSTFLHGNMKVYDTSWDGSKFFVLAELQSDKQVSQSGTYELTVFMSANAGTIVNFSTGADASGDTIPTSVQDFYHTTLNTLKRYANGAEQSGQFLSFPIMRISMVDSLVTDVRDVANGAGYIASTIWVDKEVKGLIPNGRNEDGTLRNIEWTNDVLRVRNNTSANKSVLFTLRHPQDIYYNDYPLSMTPTSAISQDEYMPSGSASYLTKENIWRAYTGSNYYNMFWMSIGSFQTNTSGVISNFQLKQPFRAVDWNDVNPSMIDGVWTASSLTLASGATIPTTQQVIYSLADYLPNDGFDYEVMVYGVTNSASVSGSKIVLNVGSDIMPRVPICQSRGIQNQSAFDSGACTIPVGVKRQLNVGYGSTFAGEYNLSVTGYRRLGKN